MRLFLEESCPDCGAVGAFRSGKVKYVWRVDIDIGNDWQVGQWDRARLYWRKPPILYCECGECGCKVRILFRDQ